MTPASLVLVVNFLAVACTPQTDTPAAPRLPNILVIMADDMGYGDPGSYNPASKIPTPNLDRVAAEGMRFTDAHAPAAVCTPTRYGLLTGRYAWRSSLKSWVLEGYDQLLIDTSRETLASLLGRHGYATGAFGKWHLGLGSEKPTDYSQPLTPVSNALGFDTFFGIPASLDFVPYVFVENESVVEAPTDVIDASAMRRHGGGGFWRAGPIAPGFRHIDVLPTVADRAVAFVEDRAAASPERPFFLYLPLSAPHTPWMPTAEFEGRSQAGPYGDFTVQVDAVVGRMLDALDLTGQADRTLVIATSDNGAHWLAEDIERYGHRANGPWRGQKADIHEGGHRIPFMARWPGVITSGSTSDETIALTDLMATFADIVGESLRDDAGEDSYSLMPVLRGESLAEPLREATVHHSVDGIFAIRQGPWKLIEGRGSGGFTEPVRVETGPGEPRGQLYNLADDPGETRNLFDDQPDIVVRLQALLDGYRERGRSRPRARTAASGR